MEKCEEMTPKKSPKKHLYQVSWRLNNIWGWNNGDRNDQENQEKKLGR